MDCQRQSGDDQKPAGWINICIGVVGESSGRERNGIPLLLTPERGGDLRTAKGLSRRDTTAEGKRQTKLAYYLPLKEIVINLPLECPLADIPQFNSHLKMSQTRACFPNRPQFSGFMKPCRVEGDVSHLEVYGEIPKEIDGVFYRVMPDPQLPPFIDDDPVRSLSPGASTPN